MAKQDKYSIQNLRKDFPNDDACLEYLFDTLHSRECSCGGTYTRLKDRKQFQCSKCRFQIAPMVDTIFQKSATPLTLWFHAIFIFSNAKSGISAKEMERQLGVTYKTAWRILKLIRESLGQGNFKLRGDVEMDEAYIGGRGNGGKCNKNYKQVMADKAKIIGAVERGGDMKVSHIQDITAHTIGTFLEDHVDVENTRLYTDSSNRYSNVAQAYDRQMVSHNKKEYVRGEVHTNHIDGFWSHVKRSVKGTHKVISQKYLQQYLDGFVFHYNTRHSDRLRFDLLLSVVVR